MKSSLSDLVYKLNEFDYFPGSFLSPKASFLGSGSLRSRRLEVMDEGKNGVLEGACYASYTPGNFSARGQNVSSTDTSSHYFKYYLSEDLESQRLPFGPSCSQSFKKRAPEYLRF